MSDSSVALVWFRRDLRLSDNPALSAAAATGLPILPVFIDDPVMPFGEAQRWWLCRTLAALNEDLWGRLVYRVGEAQAVLEDLLSQHRVEAVFWNRCYEPDVIKRDTAIKAWLKDQGVAVQSFKANLLLEAHEVQSPKGLPYKVFTPYWKKHQETWQPEPPLAKPDFAVAQGVGEMIPAFDPFWAIEFGDHWTPGEAAAQQRLVDFLDHSMGRYKQGRDFPGEAHTSRLSPHLCFGEISPRQIAWATLHRERPCASFLSELGWREFAYHLIGHWPEITDKPLKAQFAAFPWRDSPEDLRAWQKGQTGYDFVDAAMLELWRSGFMHNRLRMIAASFLVKNLRLPWLQGQAWFRDTLLDHDLAVNAASWQWVAGCGTDAAPYFRIFNPETQAEKFDADGDYRRTWLTGQALRPQPMVDLQESRQAALAALEVIKGA